MSGEFVHRLGVTVGIASAVGLPSWWVWAGRRRRRGRQRAARLLGRHADVRVARREVRGAVRRWLPEAGVVTVGWALVGGVAGVVVGVLVAAGLWRWRRRREASDAVQTAAAEDRTAAARQLPLAADLLAACVAAGAAPVAAARAVGEALGGPVGELLARGATEVRLGGEPDDAWRGLASVPGAEALARLLARADVSGLPAAGPAARLAADVRASRVRTATARARRAAALVTAPVGLCFLPAFIAVGVAPVVIGLAGGALGGGGR
ncbi:type II secretion system F family protein [Streptomyces sp. bgisy154]|uniref:type II secretion system F family protein n=1 Tax=Streptomyces sp. bgisy154 TaxID=3413794 RepID=UPI003D724012